MGSATPGLHSPAVERDKTGLAPGIAEVPVQMLLVEEQSVHGVFSGGGLDIKYLIRAESQ